MRSVYLPVISSRVRESTRTVLFSRAFSRGASLSCLSATYVRTYVPEIFTLVTEGESTCVPFTRGSAHTVVHDEVHEVGAAHHCGARARLLLSLVSFHSPNCCTREAPCRHGERLRRFTRVRTRLCSREVHEVGAVVTLLGFFSLTNWGLTSQSVSRYFSFVSFH